MVAHAMQDRRGVDLAQNGAIGVAVISVVSLCLGKTLLALILLLVSLLTALTWELITRPPVNHVAAFLNQFRSMSPSRPVLVCLGDSLTHGRVSDNWTVKVAPKVAQKMKFEYPSNTSRKPAIFQDPIWVVNAGQNSITAWVVLQERLRAALACYPDYIIVMIGTNDCLSVYSPISSKDKQTTFNLPEPPCMAGYKRDITAIIDFLTKASPKTEVGLCTLPPMGENLSSPANKIIKEANEIIRGVVDAFNSTDNDAGGGATTKVSLLEVGERLQNEIVQRNDGGKKAMDASFFVPLMSLQAPLHYFLGFSWKSVTGISSGSISHDALHLNEDGGDILAEIITEWLFQKNVHKAIAVKQF